MSAPPAAPLRPRWLSPCGLGVITIAVMNIILGVGASFGILFTRHNPFARLTGIPPEMAKMFALQTKMVASPVAEISIATAGVGLVAGVWVLIRAIRLIKAEPGARLPFRRAVVALGVAESLSMIVGLWLQARTFELFGEFVETFAPHGALPTRAATMMNGIMQGAALGGLVSLAAWGTLKLVFLAWAHRYAATPDVVAHLDR